MEIIIIIVNCIGHYGPDFVVLVVATVTATHVTDHLHTRAKKARKKPTANKMRRKR